MKKIFVASLLFILAFLSVGHVRVFAKDTDLSYQLPYPGILPDSPVYFLKVGRDKLTTFFIQNPHDRAFYLLFLSDKRLSSAILLKSNNKQNLTDVTLVSSEEHFSQALDLAENFPKSEQSKNLVAKLLSSSVVHAKEFASIKGESKNFQIAYSKNINNANRVRELVKKLLL